MSIFLSLLNILPPTREGVIKKIFFETMNIPPDPHILVVTILQPPPPGLIAVHSYVSSNEYYD